MVRNGCFGIHVPQVYSARKPWARSMIVWAGSRARSMLRWNTTPFRHRKRRMAGMVPERSRSIPRCRPFILSVGPLTPAWPSTGATSSPARTFAARRQPLRRRPDSRAVFRQASRLCHGHHLHAFGCVLPPARADRLMTYPSISGVPISDSTVSFPTPIHNATRFSVTGRASVALCSGARKPYHPPRENMG